MLGTAAASKTVNLSGAHQGIAVAGFVALVGVHIPDLKDGLREKADHVG